MSYSQVRLIRLLLLVTLWTLVLGCGGGSTGTGSSGPNDLVGKLLSIDAEPIAGAIVTILETGDSVATDSQGNFTLPLQAAGTVTLEVQSDGQVSSAVIEDLPSAPSEVSVVLALDTEDSGELAVVDIEIVPRTVVPDPVVPVPSSTPLDEVVPQPSAVPNQEDSPEPEETVDPGETPSATPDQSGSVTPSPTPQGTPDESPSPTLSPSPTESASPTVSPTPAPRFTLSGVVSASNPALLKGALIYIPMAGSRKLKKGGKFVISVPVDIGIMELRFRKGKRKAFASVSDISPETEFATLKLAVSENSDSSLTLAVVAYKPTLKAPKLPLSAGP